MLVQLFNTEYLGQVTSKKNSRVISLNRRTGHFFSRASDRAKSQEIDMVTQFRSDFCKQGFTKEDFNNLIIEIRVKVWNKDRRKHDLDNQVSTILDALVKAEIFPDDKQEIVSRIDAEYMGVDKEKPRVEIFVYGYDELESKIDYIET